MVLVYFLLGLAVFGGFMLLTDAIDRN